MQKERKRERIHIHQPTSGSNIERKKQSHKNQRALAEMCVARNIKTTHSFIVRVGLCFFVCRLLNFVFMLHTQSFNHSVDSFYLEQIHYTFVVMSERDCEQLPLLWVCVCSGSCQPNQNSELPVTVSLDIVHHSAIHWCNICHTLAI